MWSLHPIHLKSYLCMCGLYVCCMYVVCIVCMLPESPGVHLGFGCVGLKLTCGISCRSCWPMVSPTPCPPSSHASRAQPLSPPPTYWRVLEDSHRFSTQCSHTIDYIYPNVETWWVIYVHNNKTRHHSKRACSVYNIQK